MVDYENCCKEKMKDIIAAQSTPPGIGGIGIVRVSGFNLEPIIQGLLSKPSLKPRYAYFGDFLDKEGQLIDQGIAIYFKAPHSFTGEDVFELQGHGGPVVLNRVLQRVLELGARMARPGEFSERAFLNEKIDLIKAEALCDLIHAQTEKAAKSAAHSLRGDFSKIIHRLVDDLMNLRMYVEASIDFTDEEIDFLSKDETSVRVKSALEQLLIIEQTAKQGVLLQSGANIVIAGPPNSGKSSLINRLSQQDIAIVTDIPGTTRDLLSSQIQIGDGLCLQITDTAGIRAQTEDPIEREGIDRAKIAIKEADHILLVLDIINANDWAIWVKEISEFSENSRVILVLNKMDLTEKKVEIKTEYPVIYISAKTGEGIEHLKQHIKERVGLNNLSENQFVARSRHLEAIRMAKQYLLKALPYLEQNFYELLAEELKQAQMALSEITGQVSADDLLGKIFGEFCVGK